MANSARIIHAKTARATTGPDTQRVYGADWNADHVLTGLENVDNTSDDTKNAATATLTNKTIDTAGPNTIKINGNTLSATAGTATVTFPNSTDTLVGRATTDTLTNKTLTAPTITGATITTSTFNGNTWTAGTGTLTIAADKTLTASDNATVSGTNTGDQTITLTGDVTGTGTGSFAATIGATKVTSAMLNADVFSTAHTWAGQQTFVAPALGTPASGVATNLTGTASGLTAGNVTTNANLTGDVTSVGNATTLTNAPVIAKVLTGFASSTGTVTASDSILSAIQKLYGNDALKAPLASPALTGTPTAPTASPSDNSTKIATTAYVDAQVAGGVAGVASIDSQTGVFTSDVSMSTSSKVIRAIFPGFINGLTLSNNTTDATNDIDIAVGSAAEDSGGILIKLSSGLTKRLDAAWAVGTNQGGLDTGSIANTTYHVWLIQRSDTGVVDVLFSASASAPTMPANYDRKRRIGSIVRASAAIRPFKQTGDYFELVTPVQDVSVTNLGTSKVTYLMSAPIGILPILRTAVTIRNTTTSAGVRVFATDAASGATPYSLIAPATNYFAAGHFDVRADVDGYIAAQADVASTTFQASLVGWTDRRGRN